MGTLERPTSFGGGGVPCSRWGSTDFSFTSQAHQSHNSTQTDALGRWGEEGPGREAGVSIESEGAGALSEGQCRGASEG